MEISFFGNDFSPLVFGREILRKNPAAQINFFLQNEIFENENFWANFENKKKFAENFKNEKNLDEKKIKKNDGENFFSEKYFFFRALQKILERSKFGRVAIFFDRKNAAAKNFCEILRKINFAEIAEKFKNEKKINEKNLEKILENFENKKSAENLGEFLTEKFAPRDRRAEKFPQFYFFETQLLREFANENCADSVEFRRVARRFLRRGKCANCREFFFADAILGAEIPAKILQFLAGRQRQIFFPSSFLPEKFLKKSAENRELKIYFRDEKNFIKKMAEKILRTKLKNSDFEKF